MDRTIDELYTSIGKMVTTAIEGPWTEAVLEVELHSLALKMSGGYMQTDSNEPFSFKFSKEYKKALINDLIALHLKTDLDDKSRWNMMTFNLFSDGNYKADFSWNQTLADEIEKVYAAS
jgi:hypothetical protein